MLYVYTENQDEHRHLQRELPIKNNYYLLPSKQSYFLAEMLAAISFEFFQNKIPLLAEKIKEMLITSFNSTYSLANYREIMALLKKEQDNIQMYRDHLLVMNRAFAGDNGELELPAEEEQHQSYDRLFEQALQGQSRQPESLDILQLPIHSQLNIKCQSSDSKTQKTMRSDLCLSKCAETDSDKLQSLGSQSVDNVFSSLSGQFSFQNWKPESLKQLQDNNQQQQQISKQMSSFRKKGTRIYSSNKNLKQIFVSEIQYDLNRQSRLGSIIGDRRHSELQACNHQKKIRNAIINSKLKIRRK